MSSRIFASVGRFAVRHRRTVMVAWVLVVIGAGALGLKLPQRLGSGGFEVPGSQSQHVAHALQANFVGQAAEPAVVVISAGKGQANHLPAVVAGVRQRLAAVHGVDAVFVPTDGRGVPLKPRDPGRALLEVTVVGDQSDIWNAVRAFFTANSAESEAAAK